jgi:hypothetical protein
MLLGNRQRGARWLAMLKLSVALREGVMPESLSSEFLAKAVAVRDNSPDTVSAYALAYAAAFFRQDDAEAAQALETCLQYSGYTAPLVREALMPAGRGKVNARPILGPPERSRVAHAFCELCRRTSVHGAASANWELIWRRKLVPWGMAVAKFWATVWPMSARVSRTPRLTPAPEAGE